MVDLTPLEARLESEYAERAPRLFFHNWEHTQAVRKYALKIGRAAGVDLFLIETAALLHDTGYILDNNSTRHEEDSVNYTSRLAKEKNFSYLMDMFDDIKECILATRMGAKPQSDAAAAVKDADLIQFALVNYGKKVFELNFELNTNKKVFNLTLREFVRDTPNAMKMWVPYDDKTGKVGFSTPQARSWASEGFRQNYNMFIWFQEVARDLTASEFENVYISFLMDLEREMKGKYHNIIKDSFIATLAKNAYLQNKVRRIELEKEILAMAEEKITTGLALNEVIGYILQAALNALEAQAATLFIVDVDGKIHFADTVYAGSYKDRDVIKEKVLQFKPIERGVGVVGSVIDSMKPRIINDAAKEEKFYRRPSDDVHFEVKSMLTVPLVFYDQAIGALQILNKDSAGRIISFNESDQRLAQGLAQIAASAIHRARLYDSVVKTFIDLIDAKDRYTRRHTDNVIQYALRIARAIGMDENGQKKVTYAASIHDIGKIGVPETILNKEGKLTKEEFEIIKTHVTLPGKVKEIQFPPYLSDVPFVAACHHERMNGNGYQKRLVGDQIPLVSRILAIADVFDALTTDRPYRPAMKLENAIAILEDGKGSLFDAHLIEVFISGKLYKPLEKD
jgi:HD-GYP domain-containing protein (c-di-GMP phosphodiesterase class II)